MKTEHYKVDDGLLIVVNYNQIIEIRAFLQRCRLYFPVKQTVIIDDGSTDGSGHYAEQAGYQVLSHKKNCGVGAAIRTGIQYGLSNGFKWVLISSSNGKIKPEEYESVYSPILAGEADYVNGSRFMKGGTSPGLPVFRRITIPLLSALVTPLLGRRFSDITCGFRAYKLDFLNNQECDIYQDWLDRYEMEYYLHYYACRFGIPMKEVPVSIPYSHLNKDRKSKIVPIIGWWSMIRPFVYLGLGIKK